MERYEKGQFLQRRIVYTAVGESCNANNEQDKFYLKKKHSCVVSLTMNDL